MIPVLTQRRGRVQPPCAGTPVRNCSNTFARIIILLRCCSSANKRKSTEARSSFRNCWNFGGKMRLKAAVIFCLLAGLALTVSGLAQEGHPLTGTWYGEWKVGNGNGNHL